MKYAETFLSQELTQALGWTLLHSLWQGALVALTLSIILVFLNRHSAQIRYFISVTALFTTLALAAFTFFSLYRVPAKVPVTTTLNSTFSAQNHTVPATAIPTTGPAAWYEALPFTDFFASYFEKHLPLIVTIWFMGLLIMALKMLGGLAYVQRLKHYQAKPVGLGWQKKLTELQEKLHFTKPVALLESLQVKVPVAIGYLKPVILVPVGAINGLTEKQVEAILAHELAHIFRHDYLFNLVQMVVETIFFYHPAMWWISANVRAERENCCDDIALNLCGDSVAFAGALAELEEMNFATGPSLAMALSGKRGSLLSRIKRLLHQPRRSTSFSEGFIAACILMVSISAISLSAMAQLKPDFEEFPFQLGSIPAESAITSPATAMRNDPAQLICEQTTSSVPATVSNTPADLESLGYSLSVSVAPDGKGDDIVMVKDRDGKITELYVNGKKVRKKDMPAFQKIIDERAKNRHKSDKADKEYATRSEVKAARKTLRELPESYWQTAPQPRVLIYGSPLVETNPKLRFRYKYDSGTPVPPPTAPIPPLPPMPPMKPLAPLAPLSDASEAEKKEYEAEMREFEQEMKAYELEMKEHGESGGKEWKAYEAEMEAYRKEMQEYGREVGKSIRKQIYITEPGQDEVVRWSGEDGEKIIEIRKRASRDREEAAVARTKAAEARANAAETRAKEREKAAAIREKSIKERNERLEKIKTDLRKDKLIGEKDKNFSYRISKDGLFINGKKQPEATFDKYKKRYHPNLEKEGNYNEVYEIKEN